MEMCLECVRTAYNADTELAELARVSITMGIVTDLTKLLITDSAVSRKVSG